MKLLDILDDKIIISPDALGLNFLGVLWTRDKSTSKLKAMNDIKYVYYYSDFSSPYFLYPETERVKYIKEYVVGLDYKPDTKVEEAIIGYKRLNITPAMEMLEAATIAIGRMKEYFNTVDFSDGDNTITKVQNSIINMPKLMTALNEAKDICLKEQSTTTRNRGGRIASQFED